MQTSAPSHRKRIVKAELAAWHFVADTGPIAAVGRKVKRSTTAKALAAIAFVAALAIGLTVFNVAVNGSTPLTGSAPVTHVAKHVSKHSLPHREHVTKPVTSPGTHLGHHRRDWVTVRPGDTLWSIALTYLHDPYQWTRLAVINQGRIISPDDLIVGQRIYL